MIVGLTYDLRQDYLNLGFGELETAEFDRIDSSVYGEIIIVNRIGNRGEQPRIYQC